MAEFLSIREATKVTGVSATTLKRFIRTICADTKHPDRIQLLPTADEVRGIKAAGKQFTWRISSELLKREFQEKPPRPNSHLGSEFGPLGEVVALLQSQLQSAAEQLKVKDTQIASQVEIIHSLNERIHEGNVLMATVQKQFALPDAVATKPMSEKAPSPFEQSAPKRPARKGLFARLFR